MKSVSTAADRLGVISVIVRASSLLLCNIMYNSYIAVGLSTRNVIH